MHGVGVGARDVGVEAVVEPALRGALELESHALAADARLRLEELEGVDVRDLALHVLDELEAHVDVGVDRVHDSASGSSRCRRADGSNRRSSEAKAGLRASGP